MSRCGRHWIPCIILLAALSGCAPLAVPPAPTSHYQCDGGSEFSLSIAPSGEWASIEISRMQFSLQAEPSAEPGQRYACGVLTLWRDGDRARVEMDGAPQFTGCREVRISPSAN